MDIIDGGAIVSGLASSTTGYLSEFAPIFLLIGGIVLAMGLMEWLIETLAARKNVDDSREGDSIV